MTNYTNYDILILNKEVFNIITKDDCKIIRKEELEKIDISQDELISLIGDKKDIIICDKSFILSDRMVDMTGWKYHSLTCIRPAYLTHDRKLYWLFRCDCGNYRILQARAFRTNEYYHACKECTKKYRINKCKTHGDSYTRLYKTWSAMIERCNDIKNKNYGGRGIKVCDEWHEYENFKIWALNNGYSDDLTIDRVDVDGNYEPSNCRWADMEIQSNNKRTNHYITYNGQTKTISQWSKIFNINKNSIYYRSQSKNFNTPEEIIFGKINKK